MLIKILLSYLIGYVIVEIEGYYIERFMNICRKQRVTIWNLKRDKSVRLKLNTRAKEFKQICQIAKRTNCKVKIKKKKGIPFLLHRYQKRKFFFALLIVFILLLVGSSQFVWNVEIEEEQGKMLENIGKDIEDVGLKAGKLKNEINTKEIINKLRLKRQDIAWIGIEIKGTNAIVKLVKADEKPELIDEDDYCSIVSDKTGVITKINAQNGTANVKEGEVVKQGDVLINGWMEGKYTGIRYVHAKGQIHAKVWYTKHKKVKYNTTEKEETGNIENQYEIKFNNFKINLYKKLSKFKIYDTIEKESKFKLFSDFYLPISIVKKTNKELREVEKKYEVEDAKNLGIQELQQELEQEIQEKEKIVNRNINTYEHEDGVDVYVTYEVLEEIGTNEKIVF